MSESLSYQNQAADFGSIATLLPNGGALQSAACSVFVTEAASGAIGIPVAGTTFFITKAGIAALTLVAPTAGVDDGLCIRFISTTAYAHTLTATGLLATGTASVNEATFAAHAGAQVELMAYQGLWYVNTAVGITFS